MNPVELLSVSIEAIKTNKLRSVLTALGVIIGVASIILLISISAGLQGFISSQFEKLGANSLFIIPGKLEGSFGGPPRTVNKLTFSLVERLEREKSPAIVDVSPFIEIAVTARFKNETKVTTLDGVKKSYFVYSDIRAEKGRVFSEGENEVAKRVAVVGTSLARDLYKANNPIDKTISISNKSFVVIGVLEPQGNVGVVDIDNLVLIPLNSARKLTGTDLVNAVLIRTTSEETIPQAKEQVDKILRRTLGEDDYT